jgi:hypothetical protein
MKWKYSKLRFYILNALWNYKFWLNAKSIYTNITYYTSTNRLGEKESPVTKKRFRGYSYKGKIYLDNPGIQNIEKDVLDSWKQKGFIN